MNAPWKAEREWWWWWCSWSSCFAVFTWFHRKPRLPSFLKTRTLHLWQILCEEISHKNSLATKLIDLHINAAWQFPSFPSPHSPAHWWAVGNARNHRIISNPFHLWPGEEGLTPHHKQTNNGNEKSWIRSWRWSMGLTMRRQIKARFSLGRVVLRALEGVQ